MSKEPRNIFRIWVCIWFLLTFIAEIINLSTIYNAWLPVYIAIIVMTQSTIAIALELIPVFQENFIKKFPLLTEEMYKGIYYGYLALFLFGNYHIFPTLCGVAVLFNGAV